MTDQLPILIITFPLIMAIFVTIIGWFKPNSAFYLTVAALIGSVWAAIGTLKQVMANGPLQYKLGNWSPPFGIEYTIDHLSAMVVVTIALVSLLTAIYSYQGIRKELPEQLFQFYTLFLMLVTGLFGLTLTGDVFNLYVLLEVSALSSYALIAFGKGRAYMATFNYLIIGTIGACFYLLGVGYLYMKAGSLNMADLAQILPNLYGSQAVMVGFILIIVGLWIKMAFFPFHGWLPNAYSYAPTAVSCLVTPLMTKVYVYVMIRMMYTVFDPIYIFKAISWSQFVVYLACVAIFMGSIFALLQKDLKKMLTYIVIAEVGYLVGGAWLGSAIGLAGTMYHIVSDAFMTVTLFMAVGCIIHVTGKRKIQDLKGIFKKMPLTMAGFVVGALAMIGIPPTCGFFSKFYLILGAMESGNWLFVVALLFSSLINVILFFRIFEIGFFGKHEDVTRQEAPLSMLVPLGLAALSLIVIGLLSEQMITHLIRFALPAGLF